MSNPSFFGGEATNLGVVRVLPVSDFKALVEQYLNAPVHLNMTRREFFALEGGHANSPRDLAKRVPYLVPAGFAESPSKRITANATAVWLVCLDIDPEKEKQEDGSFKEVSYPAAPFVKDTAILYRQLEGLNFAVYHTAQSQPHAPRIRIMVEASGFEPGLYRAAVSHIAKLVGLPFTTTESGVVVQAMFRPTVFKDTDPDMDHPLIAYRHDAAPLIAEEFAGNVSPDAVPTKGRSGAKHTGKAGEDTSGDALAFLRPPVDGVTLEACEDALLHIEADVEYREWLDVAAALKHQFPRGEESEKAFELFDRWSSQGTKYKGKDDTSAKWDSFRPTPVGRVPVTIRTLFRRATESGWSNAKAKQECYQATRDWIRQCLTLSGLLNDALEKIIVTPLLSTSEEEGLLYEVIKYAKERFDHKSTIATLRKDLKRKRANIEAAKEEQKERETAAPPWAMGLCYVESPGEFYRFSNRAVLNPESFDLSYSRFLLPSKEALEASGQANNPGAAARAIVRPRDFVLNLLKVRTAYDYFYSPKEPGQQFVQSQGRLCVNTYRKSYPEPDESTAAEAGELFASHIRLLIAEPQYQKTFLDFLAYLVQHPGEKIRWAILVQSVKGAGKGFIEKAMRTVLGHEHVKRVDCASLFKEYNDWAIGTQLTILNEVKVHGHSRFEVMNKLKEPIADDQVSILQRYRDHREVENNVNYLLFTNYHDAIAVDEDERRYFVVKSPLQNKKQVRDLVDSGHFNKLHDMLKTHAAGLRAWFEAYQISPDFPVDGPAPETPYLEQMKVDTAPELSGVIDEIIDGKSEALCREDLVSMSALGSALASHGVKSVSPQQLAAILRTRGLTRGERIRVEGERHVLWVPADGSFDGLDVAKIVSQRLTNAGASAADKMFSQK